MPKNGKPAKRKACGQICLHEGVEVFILGNCVSDSGTVWTAERNTGKRRDPKVEELLFCETGLTLKQEFNELTSLAEKWAGDGNDDAAWWLGWLYEGTNHPKSVWYTIASIRMDRAAHGWALERLISDACHGIMCGGTPYPNIKFLHDIVEFNGNRQSTDWKSAVQKAKIAKHEPSTETQVLEVIEKLETGLSVGQAIWSVGVTVQGLFRSAAYKAWNATKYEREELLAKQREERFHVIYAAGYACGQKNQVATVSPWAEGTEEFKEWMDGFGEGLYALNNPDLAYEEESENNDGEGKTRD